MSVYSPSGRYVSRALAAFSSADGRSSGANMSGVINEYRRVA
jgi:hypothetical protein